MAAKINSVKNVLSQNISKQVSHQLCDIDFDIRCKNVYEAPHSPSISNRQVVMSKSINEFKSDKYSPICTYKQLINWLSKRQLTITIFTIDRVSTNETLYQYIVYNDSQSFDNAQSFKTIDLAFEQAVITAIQLWRNYYESTNGKTSN